MDSEAKALQAATAGVTGAGVVSNFLSSLLNQSSSQSTFSSINQIQLLMLLVLLGAYLPSKIISYIRSISMTLLSFSLLSTRLFHFTSALFSLVSYAQPDPHLALIGISSGSTLLNIFDSLVTLLLIF